MLNNIDQSCLIKEIERRMPQLKVYGEWVVDTIIQRLKERVGNEDLQKFLEVEPKPRVKTIESFLGKTIRKRYDNPIEDITDQVGARFVLLYRKDIRIIEDIIKNEQWNYQKDKDFEKEKNEQPEYFFYQSNHYIIRLKADKKIGGIPVSKSVACEIQVRTLLQHAYAEMSHNTNYKPPIHLPKEATMGVRRMLAKGLAMMEATDEIFGQIKEKISAFDERIKELVDKSAELYKEIVKEQPYIDNKINNILADAYREYLDKIESNDLEKWANKKRDTLQTIKNKRENFVLCKNAIAILICFLIDKELGATISNDWPFDLTYLEEFYSLLGYGPDNFS
jgi:ppGpp synthetase/RelA/SpoT-type nucleotidyltranferase